MNSDIYHHWISKELVDEIIERFIESRDKKYQEKTIISIETAKDILCVLKGNSHYGTANFRFWARKRFKIQVINQQEVVCYQNKPVCLKEDIYHTILKAHIDCQHKGKESTYKQIHCIQSYVPKSLVECIVKECQYCQLRKDSKKVEFYDIVDLYFDL